jgi:hypothetical protein
MSVICKMGCLYASQEQWGDEMSASINTDTLQTDKRELKRGTGQEKSVVSLSISWTHKKSEDFRERNPTYTKKF